MTFPNIYFKTNSTDYEKMPYTVDSCFKCIAKGVKDKGILSLEMRRCGGETEQLSNRRIKKIVHDLNKYTPSEKITIRAVPAPVCEQSMLEIIVIDYNAPIQ